MKRRLFTSLAAATAATASILLASGAAAATPDTHGTDGRCPERRRHTQCETPRGHPGRRDAIQDRRIAARGRQAGLRLHHERRRIHLPRADRRAVHLARHSGRHSRQGPVLGELRRLARGRLRRRVRAVDGSDQECPVAEARRYADAQHDRRVQQRRLHPANRHTRRRGAHRSVHHRPDHRGGRLHRQLRLLGEEVGDPRPVRRHEHPRTAHRLGWSVAPRRSRTRRAPPATGQAAWSPVRRRRRARRPRNRRAAGAPRLPHDRRNRSKNVRLCT